MDFCTVYILQYITFSGNLLNKSALESGLTQLIIIRTEAFIHDFVWTGNCTLINIKVLILFLPRSMNSEFEALIYYARHIPNKDVLSIIDQLRNHTQVFALLVVLPAVSFLVNLKSNG